MKQTSIEENIIENERTELISSFFKLFLYFLIPVGITLLASPKSAKIWAIFKQ